MYRLTKFFSAAAILLMLTMTATAQRREYQGSSQRVRQLIMRIDNSIDTLRQNLNEAFSRGRVYDSRRPQELNRSVANLDNAVYRLRTSFDRRQASTADVQEVLNQASGIDRLFNQYRVSARAQNTWAALRPDLNELARVFGLSWSTGNDPYPNEPPYRGNSLTGTYRLDPSRSDDPAFAANRATQNVPWRDRQRVRDQLTARLESPDQIAIERRGRGITIASSRASQITFEADGSERIETTPDGRTIRARASLSGDLLTVTSIGDRSNEFNVTFSPTDNGRRLNVTRRLYVSGLNTPVVVQSTYDKSSDVARFEIYDGSQTDPASGADSDFIVRDGETVVAELNNPLSTKTVREGDSFTMTARQPSRIAGATIVGHVSSVERSGRLTGRAQMTLNFDSIRLPDGRSYRFAGVVESVRAPNGDTVRVDNEGTVRDASQTSKTAQRTAIGTAVGATIGAIAGGGKGAAVGAIIGAGGGAGSVYIQGKDDLDLEPGTELTIRASGPR